MPPKGQYGKYDMHRPEAWHVGELVLVPCTQGRVAIVTEDQYPLVKDFNWHIYKGDKNTWYARTGGLRRVTGKNLTMHRLLRPDVIGEIDHINRNGLDNRDANLREAIARQHQNANKSLQANNSSGFRGVFASGKRWMAKIRVNKLLHLGTYNTREEAATAYDSAAIKHFGEFAVTNASLRARNYPAALCMSFDQQ